MKENNTYYDFTGDFNPSNSLRANPFTVPESYFEELPKHIISNIKLEMQGFKDYKGFVVPEGYFETLASQSISLPKLDLFNKKEDYATPEGYFENLSDQLLSQIKLDKFKSEESTVPTGYFESLADRIIGRIEEVNLPEELEGKDTGFTVPDLYFEQTEDQIFAGIAVERLKEEVKEDGYSVPSGYFDTLSDNILAKVAEPKIIRMPTEQRNYTPTRKIGKLAWFSSVAAACVALVIGVSIYNGDQQVNNTDQSAALQEIPKDEILGYLSSVSDASDITEFAEYIYEPEKSDNIAEGIEDTDLEEYLNYTL